MYNNQRDNIYIECFMPKIAYFVRFQVERNQSKVVNIADKLRTCKVHLIMQIQVASQKNELNVYFINNARLQSINLLLMWLLHQIRYAINLLLMWLLHQIRYAINLNNARLQLINQLLMWLLHKIASNLICNQSNGCWH